MDLRLQYQLSDGSWIDCGDRTDEFLSRCFENIQRKFPNKHIHRDEVIAALKSGCQLKNDPHDWYSKCRCGNFHDDKIKKMDAQRATVEMVKCSCGHTVPKRSVMNASIGTSCPECYDRMSY